MKYRDIDIDEMLNFVFASLKDKYEDLSIVYDGTTKFIDRYYYMISSFEDHEDHIIRDENYYFDMENGNLYRLDGWLFSRGELHYIANYSEYIKSMETSYSGIKFEDQTDALKKSWTELMSEDYLYLSQRQETLEQAMAYMLAQRHDEIKDKSRSKCIGTCIVQTKEGERELYLVTHAYQELTAIDICTGILVNYEKNTSEVLFQTDDYMEPMVRDAAFTYDIQAADIDGNGEDDFVVLLGMYRTWGPEYWEPEICGIVGLQQNGEFTIMRVDTDEWLSDIVLPLYSEAGADRKIENIISGLEAHFGNYRISTQTLSKTDIDDYIKAKENRIMEKRMFYPEEYFEQKLLWENFYINKDKHIQSIKVYKEHGDNGRAIEQIAVYIFDYMTEDLEKQNVPEIYQELTDKIYGSGHFDLEAELLEINFKDVNGDSFEDITMYVECTYQYNEDEEQETKERYKIVFLQDAKAKNSMKLFNDMEVEKL